MLTLTTRSRSTCYASNMLCKCATKELRERLGIVSVMDVVRKGRLAWFGHLKRKDASDCVSDCRNMEVVGSRGKR